MRAHELITECDVVDVMQLGAGDRHWRPLNHVEDGSPAEDGSGRVNAAHAAQTTGEFRPARPADDVGHHTLLLIRHAERAIVGAAPARDRRADAHARRILERNDVVGGRATRNGRRYRRGLIRTAARHTR